MKKSFLISFLLISFCCSGQNVSIDISDWYRIIDGKEYATYQFVRSSYSSSRATIVFITSKKNLLDIYSKLADVFISRKQEYTDVWILGIADFDSAKISETDKKIFTQFYAQITKYRGDNNLPEYSSETLDEGKVFLSEKKDVCQYLFCPKTF